MTKKRNLKHTMVCLSLSSSARTYTRGYADAVLESVVIFRVASRVVAEIVVPFGFAEAGFFSRRPVVRQRYILI